VVTSALSGYLDTLPSGEVYLVLLKGRRYEGEPGRPSSGSSISRSSAGTLKPARCAATSQRSSRHRRLDLVNRAGPQPLAEIFWRLALPIMAMLLTLMAIPLSYVNPRIGPLVQLMVAILVFAIYYNWISFAQSNLGQGNISLTLALLMTHGLMALIVVFVFQRQLSIYSLLRKIRKPR
jgi:lipopolysaccharide export system permease protein